MAEHTNEKATWERPAIRPLTETDSRADVQDVPATNGTSIVAD
jgi:hypothetical protein